MSLVPAMDSWTSSTKGHLLERVVSQGPLDSPCGLAIAPSSFGEFAHDLLVGNFGDGTINAFDRKHDHFDGKLLDGNGAPITIQDLWALIPGNGGLNSDLSTGPKPFAANAF